MPSILKITLAILLLLCLLKMPYGYYQLLRFIAFVVFAYLAFVSSRARKVEIAFIFGALCILFQPFFKISLGRNLWNVIDVLVAVFLILSIFIDRKRV